MIRLESFSKSYGSAQAVEPLSVTFEQGRITAVLGPNGSGKSTTLKALVGLIRPTCGRIEIDGLDLETAREAALSRISYLPQQLRFPESLTGMEILEFYARLRRLSPDAAVTAAGVSALDGALRRVVSEYSGGMARRLGLAVLALPDAPILLLDEPTAGLDPDGIRRLNDWLHAERERGKTIVFSTHRLEDAEDLADRVVILVRGRLVGDMTPEQLRQREAVEVWLRLAQWDARFCRTVESLGAEILCTDERGDLIFATTAPRAIEIMSALKAAGAEVVRFASRSSVERFYHSVTREELHAS